MGSKSPSQTSSSSSTYANPTGAAAINTALTKAQSAASTPYTPYTGELTAGVNSQENAGINATNTLGSATSGYLNTAGGLANASTAAVNPNAVNGAAIQQYENPYQSQVVNSTEHRSRTPTRSRISSRPLRRSALGRSAAIERASLRPPWRDNRISRTIRRSRT